MPEKVKQIFNWLSLKWIRIAEIIVVAWAINGMWQVITFQFPKHLSESGLKTFSVISAAGVNALLAQLLFYFFSAVLILYLLRKYERKS